MDQKPLLKRLQGERRIPLGLNCRIAVRKQITEWLQLIRKAEGIDPKVYPGVQSDCLYNSFEVQLTAEYSARETESFLRPKFAEMSGKLDTLIEQSQNFGAVHSTQKAKASEKVPATQPTQVTGWRSYARAGAKFGKMMPTPPWVIVTISFVLVTAVACIRLSSKLTALEDAISQKDLAIQKSLTSLSNQLTAQAHQSVPDKMTVQKFGRSHYLVELPDGSTKPIKITVKEPPATSALPSQYTAPSNSVREKSAVVAKTKENP
jgi:hypothetical protein